MTTQKNLVKPGRPYLYGGYVLQTRPNGSVDLIDPVTGNWVNSPTQRYARWRASVVSNFLAQLNATTDAWGMPPLRANVKPVEALTRDDLAKATTINKESP